ncbi:hypothetical protein TNCV_4491591 [Trichonephila clavipes]|nr:hypothetical protein TNCV_4491591 [Trichonephila clavipes]
MRWAEQKSRLVFGTCRHIFILLKNSSRDALKEGEQLRAAAFSGHTCCYLEYSQFVANWIVHDTKPCLKP